MFFGDLWWPLVSFQPFDVKIGIMAYLCIHNWPNKQIDLWWPLVTFSDLWWYFNQLMWNLLFWYILWINIWPNKQIDLWWPLVTFGYFSTNWCEISYIGISYVYKFVQVIHLTNWYIWNLVIFNTFMEYKPQDGHQWLYEKSHKMEQ